MNIKTIVALLLITFGVVVLAYSGLSFTTPGRPIDFIGIHIETTDRHFVPPMAGVISLVAGVILLLVKPRQIS